MRETGAFKKRLISAYIVRIQGEEDRPFEFYQAAMAYAARTARKDKVAKVMENTGSRCYVEIASFEKDPQSIIEEVKEMLAARNNTASAIGRTHAQRWQNAIENAKVPIIVRAGR